MIVGVTGYKESGKNEVGRVLVERCGFYQVALADALRAMALAIDPLILVAEEDGRESGVYRRGSRSPAGLYRLSSLVAEYGWDVAKKVKEVRRLLQRLGTEGGREVLGSDVWIRALEHRMAHLRDAARTAFGDDGDFIVTDVRFPNEAEWIRSQGGQVWRVNRPGYTSDGHPSEASVDLIDPDVVIENDGTLDDLRRRVVEAMGE